MVKNINHQIETRPQLAGPWAFILAVRLIPDLQGRCVKEMHNAPPFGSGKPAILHDLGFYLARSGPGTTENVR